MPSIMAPILFGSKRNNRYLGSWASDEVAPLPQIRMPRSFPLNTEDMVRPTRYMYLFIAFIQSRSNKRINIVLYR